MSAEKGRTKTDNKYACPVCGSTDIEYVYERGEWVCRRCGTVLSEHEIDMGKDWRVFSPEDRRKAHAYPLNPRYHDDGFGSDIPVWGRGEQRRHARNMRRINRKIRANEKKIVKNGLTYMKEYIDRLDLPSYVEDSAAIILRKSLEKKNYKRKTVQAMAAAAILLACRANNVPRTAREIARGLNISLKELWKAEKKILSTVKLANLRRMPDPGGFIPRITQKLGLSPNVERLAYYIARLVKEKKTSTGRGPHGLAAAAVYVAAILLNEKKNQQDIAAACGVTDVTIRNRYGDIVDSLDIVIEL